MAIRKNVTRGFDLHTEDYDCSEDLSGLQWCAVGFTSSATAGSKVLIGKPASQGALALGILQNAPVYGTDLGEVRHQGVSKAKAYTTFNKGVELTVHDTTGRLETALAGDYVIGFALEPATCTNALVSILLTGPYQKNA